MKKTRFLTTAAAAALTAGLLTACSQEPAENAPENLVGGDVDEHGCRASAGYQWCEATQQCERPWELAEAEGFENTAEAFDAYCGADSARDEG